MAVGRSYRSSRAFLVRSADAGEADRRLTFFTEGAGTVGVVAKAAHRSRKRFGGALQKYFLLDAAWTEEPGKPSILTSASILESFWNIVADWEKVRHADHLLELCTVLFPQPGPQPTAFAFLLAGIRSLAGGERPPAVGRKTEAAYLAMSGWGPDLSACRVCGNTESGSFRFVVSEGKLYCGSCSGHGGRTVSHGAIRTWRALQAATPSNLGRIRIPDKILTELQELIPVYLKWNLGRPLRSLGRDSEGRKP